jgi:hypothetical protein
MENKDLLGLAPYGDAIKVGAEKVGDIAKAVTDRSMDAVAQFYNDLCQPAAAEVGLLLRDKLRIFRANNFAAIGQKAQALLSVNPDGLQLKAPPRLLAEVMDSGSWCEDEKMQDMWAGLLASSCTANGKDDTNILFVDTLKRLTSGEARLIESVCANRRKGLDWYGEVQSYTVALPYAEAQEILGCTDRSEVKAHIGHLRALGLIEGAGMVFSEIEIKKSDSAVEKRPNLTPERFGLHFYVRCQGSRKSLRDFFNVTEGFNDKEDVPERNQSFLVAG